MPINFSSVSQKEASEIVAAIVEKATSDGGDPIAVAVVNFAGRLLAFAAMDNVMPVSVKLAQNKAYSAVMGKCDTTAWGLKKKNPELVDFDTRNFNDENFTGFTGGVLITVDNQIIGGVAVSGRKGKMDKDDILMQDKELAEYGRSFLI
jgi:uncharacterized protein GlcG (DUF336 family)